MKRRFRWIAVALIALAVFVVFFTDLVNVVDFLPKVRFSRTTTWASSTVTLQSVRDVYQFNTVEYVHRVVFPYDYLPNDITLSSILAKIRNGRSTVVETLSPEEYLYFTAYNLALDVGIDPGAEREFLVVTVVITAGFDLTDSPLAQPDDDGQAADLPEGYSVETVQTDDGERRVVTIPEPSPTVTDVQVEDINRSRYPYPDVSLGADDWRRVAAFVKTQASELPELNDVLETAAATGREFVRSVLLAAGFDEVRFVQP